MYVIDLEGNEYPLQVTRTKTLEINNNETISFTILPTKVNLDFINDITEYWTIVDHDDERYKVIYFRKKGEGKLLSVDIQAIPVYIDELKRRRVYERIDQHMTAHAYFTLVFQDTNYNFVLVDSFEAQMWEGLGEGNDKASMFRDGLNRYGAEFEKVGNTFYLRSLISRETQFMYRHRLNASDITFENDASEFYTFIRGYGDYGDGEGGEDWQDAKLIREYTSPLAQIFGIREAPPLKDGRITDQTTMDEKLKQIVDESLKISVTAKVHDLRKQGYPLAQPRLGDKVFLIDERIEFNEELRIVAIEETRDWKGEIIDENVTFGELNLVKRHQAKLLNAVNTINSLLRGQTKLPFSVMDNAVAEATKALHRMQSELNINEQGSLVAVDKNDPNNVVVFNAAGLGVSDDGGATFKSAITGKGVVAETIVGQSIIGVNLTSVDQKGYFHVNGSDAEFVDTSTGRRVELGPDGLYGYNSNNSIRFQADRTFVTSSAFGTSNANVYMVAQDGYEGRVVRYNEIPGDGQVDSYVYLPIRAQVFRFPRIPYGYITILDGGEFRFTGENINNPVYQNVRMGRVFSNNIEVNDGDILYLRSNNRVRARRKGTSETFIPFEGSDFIQSSSKEIKKNIKDFKGSAIEEIQKLNIIEFDYINGEKGHIGVLAEESPVLSDDGESVSLTRALFLNLKGTQELTKRVEAIEEMLNEKN